MNPECPETTTQPRRHSSSSPPRAAADGPNKSAPRRQIVPHLLNSAPTRPRPPTYPKEFHPASLNSLHRWAEWGHDQCHRSAEPPAAAHAKPASPQDSRSANRDTRHPNRDREPAREPSAESTAKRCQSSSHARPFPSHADSSQKHDNIRNRTITAHDANSPLPLSRAAGSSNQMFACHNPPSTPAACVTDH